MCLAMTVLIIIFPATVMRTESRHTAVISLKKLLVVETMILGFCLWLACLLQAPMEIPIWYQSSVKTLLALFLIVTMPGCARLRLVLRRSMQTGLNLMVCAMVSGMTLLVSQMLFDISSHRDMFIPLMLGALAGQLVYRNLFRKSRSAEQG